ncbi:MAG TPA: hypothetical protein VJN44_18665 [Roseateles sp.]|nr:hypothetical protein [Roseateles sp.]
MITTATKTFVATALIAVGAAALFTLGHAPAAPAPQIVKLERVVIVGKRADGVGQLADAQRVEQLPRVVIVGKRAALDGDLQVAALAARCSSADRVAC